MCADDLVLISISRQDLRGMLDVVCAKLSYGFEC